MSSLVSRNTIDNFERVWKNDTRQWRDEIDSSPRAAWMVSRVIALLVAAALIVGVGLVAPVIAQVSDQRPAVRVYTLTPERLAASAAAVVALIGAVAGGLALARSTARVGIGNGRHGAIVALVMGPIGLIIGGLVVATGDGGLGTGNGLAGGIVAMPVGLIALALGRLALARSRRVA